MKSVDQLKIKTLGQLKASGYQSKGIKQELRENLISSIKGGSHVFDRVIGYSETVIPELQRAILAGHNINLLGLRGQAKTTIARSMVNLLDEYIPALAFSELNEDPLRPITKSAIDYIQEHGDETPVKWIHRSDRYTEKLATPDVSVADLIGDLDPIKAATLKLSYSDERAIHYGLIPHSNRGIFVINELPDLQPRIQVALFNILQEGDVQIRGFKVRMPLDIQFVFTANPEDYTNRGSIITPLKDRIQSQIITHYPAEIETARLITAQEVSIDDERAKGLVVQSLLKDLIEQIGFAARESEFVDQKSGVSARLSISAYESLVASAELRMLKNGDKQSFARISDLLQVVPAITGKVELVYEGEQEGAQQVAHNLIRQAIRNEFVKYFSNPERLSRKEKESPYQRIIDWFSNNQLDLNHEDNDEKFRKSLLSLVPLNDLIESKFPGSSASEKALWAEFVLHALAEYSLISKKSTYGRYNFNDMLNAMLN